MEARQGSRSNFCEGPGLGLGSRSTFKARDRPGIDFLGLDPSLIEPSVAKGLYNESCLASEEKNKGCQVSE